MHRLSWQRVWVISSRGEGVRVTGLAWRPDSKILAVGYSTGNLMKGRACRSTCVGVVMLCDGECVGGWYVFCMYMCVSGKTNDGAVCVIIVVW